MNRAVSRRRTALTAVLLGVLAGVLGPGAPGVRAATKKTAPARTSSRAAASSRSTRQALALDRLPAVEIENAQPALEAFFHALRDLGDPTAVAAVKPVRVIHFGDSHVTADFWTGELRSALQARFGAAGTGYVMPGKPWRYFRHSLAKTLGGGWTVDGLQREPTVAFAGLSGVGLVPRPRALQAGVTTVASDFEVQVGLPDGNGCVRVLVDGEQVFAGELGLEPADPGGQPLAIDVQKAVAVVRPLPNDVAGETGAPDASPGPLVGQCQALAFIRNLAPLPLAEHLVAVEADCGGSPVVLGMDFSNGRPGLVVDTMGINGAEIERLDRWQPGLRHALLAHADPRLIIVSYGANDMTSSGFTREGYRDTVRSILAALRRDAAGAAILVTGPFDRSTRRKGARREQVRVNEPALVAALREAALAEGCAFWDARAAMGGENAILAWRRAGLAQRDLVHLTQSGYIKLGRMLFERFMAGYDAYISSHTDSPRGGET